MSSTFTVNLHIEEPGLGDYPDSWNVPLNSDLTILDQATGTSTTIAFTNANVTLSVAQAAYFLVICTGTLTGNVELIFPAAVGGRRIVWNQCTGAFTLKALNGSGDTGGGVVCLQGNQTPVILTAGRAYIDQLPLTLSILPAIASDTILGNNTGGSATPIALTETQASALVLAGTTAGFGTVLGATSIGLNTTQPPYGFDSPINLGLTASAAASALTINLVGANGSTPSSTNPVLIPFRSTTLATGVPVWSSVTSALSVVVPASATLGTSSSNAPFRIWVFVCYNGGTPELGVAVCSTVSGTIYPASGWETSRVTTITISSGATSSGILYTTNGVLTDSVRIIGYAEYGSGLSTAGTWASGPTTLQLMGPGVKKPGDIVQQVSPAFGTLTPVSFNSSPTPTNVTASITPTSTPNLVRYQSNFTILNGTALSFNAAQMYRGSTAIGAISRYEVANAGGATETLFVQGVDAPGVTSTVVYTIEGTAVSGTGQIPAINTDSASMELQEIMG